MIELLAVVAILMLLFVLYWGPRRTDSHARQAQQDCRTHLQRIYIAMDIYANEHAGKFPDLPGARTPQEALDALVPQYMADTTVFLCPGTKDPPLGPDESFRQHRISYAYYMGRHDRDPQLPLMSDWQVGSASSAAGAPTFSTTGKPPGNNHGKRGGNFLFCDGHAEASPPSVPFSIGLTQGVILLNPDSK